MGKTAGSARNVLEMISRGRQQPWDANLFGPDSSRNFFREGDEDDLVEKLIELLG
jgi:hypothetical protein